MNTEQIEKIAIDWKDLEKPEDIKWSPRYVEYKLKNLFLELLEIEKQRELTVKTGLRMRNYLEQFSNYSFSFDREKIFLDIAGCKINLELDFNTPTWGIEYNSIQLVK
jgi:chromosome condensin MukBEF complex kleisin-like MukF subunit